MAGVSDFEVCMGCAQVRPVSEFFSDGRDWRERGDDPLRCEACRAEPAAGEGEDAEAEEIDWSGVPKRVRRLLKRVFVAGDTYEQAARHVGLSPGWGLSGLFERHPESRRIYMQLIRAAGLDEAYLAQMTRMMLVAQKPLWNKANGCWDFFPDNATRLRALEMLKKEYGTAHDERAAPSAPRIIFLTNVGDGAGGRLAPRSGSFVIEANATTLADDEDDARADH